jgi:putative hemolysin
MDIFVLLMLILLNGLFSMSEIAVISCRKFRLQKLSHTGNRRAQAALSLKTDPVPFLSTVQVGITMVGILSGTIGETALVDPFSLWLNGFPTVQPYARGVAIVVVIVTLTFFSVVVGELVPKQLGLMAPEKIAMIIALPMKVLAYVTQPLIWLLSASSNLVLRLFRQDRGQEPPVTNAEIRLLMKQGAEAGVFHESEKMLVANVLRLDEQSVRAVMTPRQEIYLIDLDHPETEILKQLAGCPFAQVVVCRGGLDRILGILRIRDLLTAALGHERLAIERWLQPPLYLWEGVTTTQLIENMRKANSECALVVDEYGEVQGLATLTDVFASIVGDLASSDDTDEKDFVKREDGSWLVDGSVAVERLKLQLKIDETFPGEKKNAYITTGGLIIYLLGKIPSEGDFVEHGSCRFEVVDMDHNRVDKVLVSLLPE